MQVQSVPGMAQPDPGQIQQIGDEGQWQSVSNNLEINEQQLLAELS